MPRSVRWLAAAWDQLQELPTEMFKDAQRVAGGLMADPCPQDAEPDPEIPDTFIIRTKLIVLFYRLSADEIDIAGVWPDS
ncbi:hypothetical protein [Actinomadura rudentiformis]|uniref:Type II toxin-antitoxin system RelE/ParE family toxin n=1 Tax=Actinomadura rudentiformis TaxID=359158 RepID=A0A6H9Z140_9ACTN|nr:hypothetical protein [Actinomadura rudentiformis]KAB2350315.1 hypothetical protein F8566_11095 [Actinomadura rudentiformis]